MNLVARFCSCSTRYISLICAGLQTGEPYVMMGRTRDKYKCFLTLVCATDEKVLLIRNNIRYALAKTRSICLDHDRSDEKIIPRSLLASCIVISLLFMKYRISWIGTCLEEWNCVMKVLSSCKHNLWTYWIKLMCSLSRPSNGVWLVILSWYHWGCHI